MSQLVIHVVDSEQDLWQFEEPIEPVIIVTKELSSWWVYSDDSEAYRKGFEDEEFLGSRWGDDSAQKERAVEYAKAWAKAVRGVWEEI